MGEVTEEDRGTQEGPRVVCEGPRMEVMARERYLKT